ncbi:MAG: hypothetical protein J0H12_04825 [Candidatus Paracaedimonas acanthamoebae]|mgnify:FL=1|uniref:Uncharacterized protein n=1 Tax=Candidatus Paracaedimonas acanthamoebae TaxID=244581 RepID=A0A8J7PT02_9PROT|nr:hypothetical protein [Candidatus Paracaedimonas acanthamoebae]
MKIFYQLSLTLLLNFVAPLNASVENTPTSQAVSLDQIATFLAGIPQSGAFADYEQSPEWQDFSKDFEDRWTRIQEKRLLPMKAWRDQYLDPITLPLFYPMGGPDVLNALLFFPQSPEYFIIGLERVGKNLSFDMLNLPEKRQSYLQNVQNGTSSLFHRSFFITKDMSKDFFDCGVLPTLLALLKRSQAKIKSITFVKITSEGDLLECPDHEAQGVSISFLQQGHDKPQTLTYFRQNMNDNHIHQITPFLKKKGPWATMFKSASYTPHQTGFAKLVDFVLENTTLLLQDDTGLPYRVLQQHQWQLRYFGVYEEPYGESFVAYKQPDLARYFVEQKDTIRELPFRIGYGYGKVPSNLLIAMPPIKDAEPVNTADSPSS